MKSEFSLNFQSGATCPDPAAILTKVALYLTRVPPTLEFKFRYKLLPLLEWHISCQNRCCLKQKYHSMQKFIFITGVLPNGDNFNFSHLNMCFLIPCLILIALNNMQFMYNTQAFYIFLNLKTGFLHQMGSRISPLWECQRVPRSLVPAEPLKMQAFLPLSTTQPR